MSFMAIAKLAGETRRLRSCGSGGQDSACRISPAGCARQPVQPAMGHAPGAFPGASEVGLALLLHRGHQGVVDLDSALGRRSCGDAGAIGLEGRPLLDRAELHPPQDL